MNAQRRAADKALATLVPGLDYQVYRWGCISNGDRATATGRTRIVDGWPEVEVFTPDITAWVPAEDLAQPWDDWDPR